MKRGVHVNQYLVPVSPSSCSPICWAVPSLGRPQSRWAVARLAGGGGTMGTWRSTRCVRKWRSTKTSRLCRPRSHSSSRVHMFLEARRGAVLPRRVPSRTSSVVLVDALRQRTSPRCLARTPAPCEQARPSSSVLCDRADNSGSYVPAGSVGTSHSPWRPEWAVEGRVAADAAIACAMLQASGLRIPMSLAHSQQSTVDLGK